jgi:hypothetical protein
MGRVFDEITPELAAWIAEQPVFFVATAPSGAGGHVNLSPKGLDTFRVLDGRRVAYLDLTGSGVETLAHLRDNGRITIMFCAFSGNPQILRLFGSGRAHPVGGAEYEALAGTFDEHPGARSIVEVACQRVQTSCGYGVPLMDLVSDRERLTDWARAKGEPALVEYRATKNATSIDGLPGFWEVEPA